MEEEEALNDLACNETEEEKVTCMKLFRETRAYADQLAAKKEAQALSHLTSRLRRDFEKDIARNAKKNPKAFWID